MGSLREMENLALRVDEFFRRAIVLSDPSFRANVTWESLREETRYFLKSPLEATPGYETQGVYGLRGVKEQKVTV